MLSSELRAKAVQYLESEISLQEFETWYSERMLLFVGDVNSADADFVAAIELALAEYYDDYRTEEEVKDYIKEMLANHETILFEQELDAEGSITTGSSSVNVSGSTQVLIPVYQW